MIESRCGLICSSCEFSKIKNCSGCAKIQSPFWGKCSVKSCCESKALSHCGECSDFPCELLGSFAYDKEHGDNGARIEKCREWLNTVT